MKIKNTPKMGDITGLQKTSSYKNLIKKHKHITKIKKKNACKNTIISTNNKKIG